MAIRMIATDLDGTLLNPENRISEENKAALREAAEKNICVTIATGRMYCSALPYAKEIGVDAPIITYNGALVKTTAGEELSSSCIEPEDVRAVLDFMRRKGWYVQVYSDDRLYFVERDKCACSYEENAGIQGEAVGWDGLYAHVERVHKLLSITDVPEEMAGRLTELEKAFSGRISPVRSKPCYLDITAPGVSKAQSLRRLAESRGIAPEEVLALGDSDNDIAMLSSVGIGVAMTTGTKGACAAARFLVENEAADGVARAVRAHAF